MEGKETSGNISLFTTPLFLFFIAIFLFMALINGSKGLAVLSIVVFCMAGGAKLWTRFCLRKTEYRLTTDKTKVFPGEGFLLDIIAKNQKPLPMWLAITVPDKGFSGAFSVSSPLSGERGLLWYQQARFRWDITAAKRGVYEIGPFLASTGDLFGFFKKTRIQNEKAEIVVYPRIVPLVPVSLPRRDFFGIPGGKSPVDDPVYILGTTDYHYGRPAKHIHWKASVRHQRLQEKLFDSSEQEKVLVIIDVEQFAECNAGEAFERTLEVAASLVVAYGQRGCSTGFLTNGKLQGAPPFLPITKNRYQVSHIMDALARLQMQPAETTGDILGRKIFIPHGTSCVYFAFQKDDATRVALANLKRRGIPVMFCAYDVTSGLRRDEVHDVLRDNSLHGTDHADEVKTA